MTSLGIGEAVVTVLSEKGAPTPVAWTRMRVPRSLMAAIGADAVAAAAKSSPLQAKYGQTIEQAPAAPVGPSGEVAPTSGSDFPPVPTEFQVPPMPEPAQPKEPAMWEEVLKNPTAPTPPFVTAIWVPAGIVFVPVRDTEAVAPDEPLLKLVR